MYIKNFNWFSKRINLKKAITIETFWFIYPLNLSAKNIKIACYINLKSASVLFALTLVKFNN